MGKDQWASAGLVITTQQQEKKELSENGGMWAPRRGEGTKKPAKWSMEPVLLVWVWVFFYWEGVILNEFS